MRGMIAVDQVLRYQDQVALCQEHLRELTASRLIFLPEPVLLPGHAAPRPTPFESLRER